MSGNGKPEETVGGGVHRDIQEEVQELTWGLASVGIKGSKKSSSDGPKWIAMEQS